MNIQLRRYPHLIELNTRSWLRSLEKKYQHEMTLDSVPNPEWDHIKESGFDIIWLMGVWSISMNGRRLKAFSKDLKRAYSAALPNWSKKDVVGSPFAITDYKLNPDLGDKETLLRCKEKLHKRGMLLVLDFVPNHVAFDHPWTLHNPHYFIKTESGTYSEHPDMFFTVPDQVQKKEYYIAHGKDPYFPSWTDTAQLDYWNMETRKSMIEVLKSLSLICDGVRCDMAMLCLNAIIQQTWGWLPERKNLVPPETEFWQDAITTVRKQKSDFLFLAEVYWNLEWRLQQLGFNYTYDKMLYDRLRFCSPIEIKQHLLADDRYQERSVRFIENHDEQRALEVFGSNKVKAATVLMSTIKGLRFYHQGQLEAKSIKLPVQLIKTKDEEPRPELEKYFRKILEVANRNVFHEGSWRLLKTYSNWHDGESHQNLLAWDWNYDHEHVIVVINWSNVRCQGRVILEECFFYNQTIQFFDHLNGKTYSSPKSEIEQMGLFIDLEAYSSHILEIIKQEHNFAS